LVGEAIGTRPDRGWSVDEKDDARRDTPGADRMDGAKTLGGQTLLPERDFLQVPAFPACLVVIDDACSARFGEVMQFGQADALARSSGGCAIARRLQPIVWIEQDQVAIGETVLQPAEPCDATGVPIGNSSWVRHHFVEERRAREQAWIVRVRHETFRAAYDLGEGIIELRVESSPALWLL
jgi:hypothetical protein